MWNDLWNDNIIDMESRHLLEFSRKEELNSGAEVEKIELKAEWSIDGPTDCNSEPDNNRQDAIFKARIATTEQSMLKKDTVETGSRKVKSILVLGLNDGMRGGHEAR